MTDIRCIATMKKSGAVPKDRFVNTWCFTGTDSAATMAANASTLLLTFYKTVASPATVAVSGFIAPCVSRAVGDFTLQFYNLADPTPRVPILTTADNIANNVGGTAALPSEVAACLSFQATRVSGISQARRRGRVYIGPLGNQCAAGGLTAFATVDPGFSLALRSAALRMKASGTAGTSWAVWSPTSGVARVVNDGWVDDAFDTQRRRGIAAGNRNTW